MSVCWNNDKTEHKIIIPFRNPFVKLILQETQKNPKEFMYGAYELLIHLKNIEIIFEAKKRDTFLKKIMFLFEKPFALLLKLGMAHEIVLCHREKYASADKVVCLTDTISFALLFWKAVGYIRSDLYTLFQSLSERKLKYFNNNLVLIWVLSKLLSRSNKIIVLSNAAKNEIAKSFRIAPDHIAVFHFGADLSFWNYKQFDDRERTFILSVGNDMNRDFETLIKAVAGKYKLIIVTNKKITCDGVIIKKGISNHELRDLYHHARLVITPSIKVETESSGLSTTVQAMACGAPVIITDSPPMRELFCENEHILYTIPENYKSLRDAIEHVWDRAEMLSAISYNARKLIEMKYNSNNMAKQLHSILYFNEQVS